MGNRYTNRVERGASLLDLHCPNWIHGIYVDYLDMKSSSDDILSQLHGPSHVGIQEILRWLEPAERMRLLDYGFFLAESEQEYVTPSGVTVVLNRFAELTQAWKNAINWRYLQWQRNLKPRELVQS